MKDSIAKIILDNLILDLFFSYLAASVGWLGQNLTTIIVTDRHTGGFKNGHSEL